MRPALVLLAATLSVSACVGQRAPDRAPLPDIAEVVTPPGPCSATVGDSIGVEIVDIVPDTPASDLLRRRDRIIGLAGMSIAGLDDVREVMRGRTPDEAVTARVVRAGEPREITVPLTSDPAEPGVGRLGISVVPAYTEVAVAEMEAGPGGGTRSRLVEVEGAVLSVDPESGLVAPWPGSAPADTQFWHAIGRVAYWVEDPSADPVLRGTDGSVAVVDGGRPARVLGSVGTDLLVAVIEADIVTVRRITPEGWRVRWGTVVDPDIGFPVAAYASPNTRRLLVVMGSPGTETLRFVMVDGETGRTVGELTELEGVAHFGWFDDDELLVQRPGSALERHPIDGGASTVVELPVTPTAEVRVWPVGDGLGLLVESGGRLLLTDGADSRPILVRCRLGSVGQPGSGRWES